MYANEALKRIVVSMAGCKGFAETLLELKPEKLLPVEDVKDWNNPRLKVSPYAWDGLRMYKTMLTVQGKYGVRFEFCTKAQTGKRIIEILNGGMTHG